MGNIEVRVSNSGRNERMSGTDYVRKTAAGSKGRGTSLFDGIQAFVDGVLSFFRMVFGKRTLR